MGKRFLSVSEAGKELGLGKSRAYELVAEGYIPSVRFGRRILVPSSALEALEKDAIERALLRVDP